MTLSNERAELLVNYLEVNKEKNVSLFETSPEDAVKIINADGYDFSEEELVEFAERLKAFKSENGELGEDALEDVAGGCRWCYAAVAVGVAISIISW